jgi:hypothetical protein
LRIRLSIPHYHLLGGERSFFDASNFSVSQTKI